MTSTSIVRAVSSIAVGVLLTAGFTVTSFSASASESGAATQAAAIDAGSSIVDGTIDGGTIAYTGEISIIADSPAPVDSPTKGIHVPGLGYVVADVSAISAKTLVGEFTVWLTLPADFDVSGDRDATFRALATYSVTVEPLVAVRATAATQ